MPKRGKKNPSEEGKSRKKKKSNKTEEYEYVSDDDRLYGDAPDPESREYFYDEIDEFHAKRDKILIDDGVQEDKFRRQDSEEEEVLGLDSSDSDDDEIRQLKSQLRRVQELRKKSTLDSDLEEEGEEEEEDSDAGLPDSRAWGQKRKKYYGEEDIVLSGVEDEEGDAALEEQEALKLQRQMAEQLDDQDFGLDIFKLSEEEKEPANKEQKIVKDLSKLSKREKLQLLKKESPELLTLIEEYKDQMTEVQDRLEPMRLLIQDKQITGTAADYIHTKLKLNLNYCINILFYLVLKSKQVPVHNHPVIKRLLQHRNLLKQLEPVDEQLKDEITDILSRLSAGQDITFDAEDTHSKLDRKKFVRRHAVGGGSEKGRQKKLQEMMAESDGDDFSEEEMDAKQKVKTKAKKSDQYETRDEQAALDYYKMMKKKGLPETSDVGDDDDDGNDDDGLDDDNDVEGAVQGDLDEEGNEETMDGKRAINYQIEKNKGLTAKKRKELRNPRVKHRMKFKKAKIRRKGQIREVRTEVQRYGGEISGIRAGIKRGIKLK